MAHTNRYFIVAADSPNLPQIYDVIVGKPSTQRYSIAGDNLVVKLHKDDHKNYPFLDSSSEYNHAAILEIMHTPEWQEELPIIDNR